MVVTGLVSRVLCRAVQGVLGWVPERDGRGVPEHHAEKSHQGPRKRLAQVRKGQTVSDAMRRRLREVRLAQPSKPLPVEKFCNGCHIVKPASEFWLNKKRNKRAQLKSKCKKCVGLQNRANAKKHPERTRRYHREWNRRNRPYFSDRGFRKRYGITLAMVHEMVLQQEGRCAICLAELVRQQVDHDHVTGKVRALLCQSCNCGLGSFRDSIETMKRAITYLEKHDTASTS